MDPRIAVLGYGIFSSLGNNTAENWENLIAGKVGIKELPEHIGVWVRSRKALLADVSYSQDRLIRMAKIAADEALGVAGNPKIDFICVGSSSASFAAVEQVILVNQTADASLLKPQILARRLSEHYGLRPHQAIQCSQACASSSYAIAMGADLIRKGYASVVLVGGVDEVTASVVAGFESCRIHGSICRPFDKRRRGLVLGEAAAFLILSNDQFASENGLAITAFVDGHGLTCDAYNMAAPDPSGNGIVRAIEGAVRAQDVKNIDFVCAHGTGTRQNDSVEARALKKFFNNLVPPVASYKGSLGHPQGASGACGTVLAVLAMRHNVMFPNVGLLEQDETIDLDIVKVPRSKELRQVLCLSYGSWGANAALLISAAQSC